MTDSIERIERFTLSTMVANKLRDLIREGAYPPGTQLGESTLASQFGVSRGPVREALQGLVQEGLLRKEPHRGVFVPILSDADIADLYLARAAIEAAAFRVLANTPNRAGTIDRLKQIVLGIDRATSSRRWRAAADLDLRFHVEVVHAAGSRRLSQMYDTLIDETRSIVSLTATYPGREGLGEAHDELARLLEAGDLDGGLKELKRHFAASWRTLQMHHVAEA